jgi:hypothetical protein
VGSGKKGESLSGEKEISTGRVKRLKAVHCNAGFVPLLELVVR